MSQEFSLSTADKRKWLENQIEFLKPMVLVVSGLYFGPIVFSLSQPGHIVSLNDFIPSGLVVTSIVFYLVNALWDILRKWASKSSR